MKPTVKHRLEASLGVDVNGVRVHNDGNAQAANRALRARAFTHRNHIFLGAGQSQHDMNLMAHEGTHVLQQEGIARRKPSSPAAGATGSDGRDAAPAGGVAPAAPAAAAVAGRALPGPTVPGALDPSNARATSGAAIGAPAAPGAPPAAPATPLSPSASTAVSAAPTPATAAPGDARKEGVAKAVGPEDKGAAKKEAEKKDKGKPAAAKGGGGGGAAGAGDPGAAAGPLARGPGEGAAAHPGAAAAAAARLAADRDRMAGVSQRLGREAFRQKGPAATRPKHQSTSIGFAKAASGAAISPDNEPDSEAETARVTELEPKEGGSVKKETFLELVDQKLAALKTPSTMEQMDDFKDKKGAQGLKDGLDDNVKTETDDAKEPLQKPLDDKLKLPPKRQETGLGRDPGHAPVACLGAPATRAGAEGRGGGDARAEPRDVEEELEKHRLTKERMEKANDPRFTAVQKAREDVHEHAGRAPGEFRREEAAKRASAKPTMAGRRIPGRRQDARLAHHRPGHRPPAPGRGRHPRILRPDRIASDIDGLYQAAEKKVRKKLEWLAGTDEEEGEVDKRFTEGEQAARDDFEGYVDDEMQGVEAAALRRPCRRSADRRPARGRHLGLRQGRRHQPSKGSRTSSSRAARAI